MEQKMTAQQLQEGLEQFYVTEDYHQWSALYPKFVLTDGAKFLAENAGAFWLMDIIGSWQMDKNVKQEEFQVWRLWRTDVGGCVVTCDDGNDNIVALQRVEYTDFPLSEMKLYAAAGALEDGTPVLVIMLPSEN
jgi:hypothetical protein